MWDDIITRNMDFLPMPMKNDNDRVHVPYQPHTENILDQPFNTENNGDTNVLGLGVNVWQEIWHDNFPVSTPISQELDGGRNSKGKRLMDSFSSDPNESNDRWS